ncbi:MAG: DUF3040 domain-containing protein [Acidimicrobiales bacterium]
MPLSEEEQRILQEIEKNFYDSDPEFAGKVGPDAITRHAGRRLRLSAAGFVVGLVGLVLTFTASIFVAFAFFALMVASAVIAERSFRVLSRAGIEEVAKRTGGLNELLLERRRRMRERFNRDDS